MKVILICGKRGSGKDTFAKFINGQFFPKNFCSGFFFESQEYPFSKKCTPQFNSEIFGFSENKNIPIVKFASPLKSIMGGLMGLSPDVIENYEKIKDDPEKIEYNGSVRDYMMGVGEVVRKIDPDFFAKRLHQELLERDEEIFMCTDWRYSNECEYLRSKSVEIIKVRICRENNPLVSLDHHSETSLDDYPMDHKIHVI